MTFFSYNTLVFLTYAAACLSFNFKSSCFNLKISSIKTGKHFYTHCYAEKDENNSDSAKKGKKSTLFDRVVDDFVGKRYGAGEKFYGRRLSKLSEAQYSDLMRGSDEPEEAASNIELKDNAILVVGEPGSPVHVMQWVVQELLGKILEIL